MLVPIFAKPENVISFSGRAAFVAFLERHGMPLREWGEEKVHKLWKEVTEGDAIYVTGEQFLLGHVPVRWIITLALRVMMCHPELGWIVLIEFVIEDGQLKPRKPNNSSPSEKYLLRPDGSLAELPAQTAIRCLWQEASILVPKRELRSDTLVFLPWMPGAREVTFGDARHVEHDLKNDNKYAPLWTFNQVAHYSLYLSPKYYKVEGHRDQATRYYSFWKSVHDSTPIEPRPYKPALTT